MSEVRVAEVLPDRLAAEAKRHGIEKTYGSEEELFASDVDAVAIFTLRWTHGELVVRALEAGKHVYSCVSMAIIVAEIEAIIDKVRSTGLTYMMGETSYYCPSSLYCRQKLAAGEFGRVFYAERDYVHDMDIGFYEAYKYSGGDRWKETASFPPMLYPTHAVDNDISNASALFKLADGGAMRTNEMRRVGYPSHIRESRLHMSGTEGSFEQMATRTFWQQKTGVEDITDEIKPRRSKSLDDPELAGVDPALREAFVSGCAPAHAEEQKRLPKEFVGLGNGHDGSHQFLADDFVRAVVDGTTPTVNAWVAARFTLPGIVAHESAKQGGAQLEIPDFGSAPA